MKNQDKIQWGNDFFERKIKFLMASGCLDGEAPDARENFYTYLQKHHFSITIFFGSGGGGGPLPPPPPYAPEKVLKTLQFSVVQGYGDGSLLDP